MPSYAPASGESSRPSGGLRRALQHAVRERHPEGYTLCTERHLQCVWFDDALRPPVLHTHDGEAVAVEDAGRWNLEAGPDFLGATLRIGPDQRRLRGDVELHLRASDWHAHGHAHDPRYAAVMAHVTYAPGALPEGDLPAGAVQLSLKEPLARDPYFSFESIDVTTYPHARRSRQTPCAPLLAARPMEAVAGLLEAAGEQRVRLRTERLALRLREESREQVFYEEVMAALGYKHNRKPFRRLAERVPLLRLREAAAGDVATGYAVLLGVAGLMPRGSAARWDSETRLFVRRLWDTWWKVQSRWRRHVLRAADWTLCGLRPQNRPERRLMAAACLFVRDPPLLDGVRAGARERTPDWMGDAARRIAPPLNRRGRGAAGPPPHTYWHHRLSFSGERRAKPVALVGRMRAAAIVSNVVVPFLAAVDRKPAPDAETLRHLPAEADNALIRLTAKRLLGPDHNPALYRTGLRQQGLLQIFHDFCLIDRSRCERCGLAEMLRRHGAE
ncbi:MAG: DUF2851 family protein [Kiritimatiellae bacterium]|nr:DUF2851 family protein [Kiritimatiellia bacterium]